MLYSVDIGTPMTTGGQHVVGTMYHIDCHVFSGLSSLLPCFGLFQWLYVHGDSKSDAVFLGPFLQAWPLRHLTESQIFMSHVSLALGLPGDFAYKCSDVQML